MKQFRKIALSLSPFAALVAGVTLAPTTLAQDSNEQDAS
jgi:hypothetical protein